MLQDICVSRFPQLVDSLEEELQMTIQIGMIGSNGIVLASDTRWTKPPRLRPGQFWAGGLFGEDAHKIKIDYERGLAVSMAKCMETAEYVADLIISELPEEDYGSPEGAIERIAARVPPPEGEQRQDAQCIIVVSRPTPRLFQFQFANVDGVWSPYCKLMLGKAIAGDNINSAIFWAESYYDEHDKKPIESLIPLAAHLVFAAHRLNPYGISGLEIVTCDLSGKIDRLSEESISQLLKTAHDWDSRFGESILAHSQKFSYAPRMSSNTRLHRRGDAQRLVNPTEVVERKP